MRELVGHSVVDFILFYNDADLSSRLNRIRFRDGLERLGKRFELLQPLHISFHRLSPRTGAGSADRISRLNECRDWRFHGNIIMVGADGVHNKGMLSTLLRHLGTYE